MDSRAKLVSILSSLRDTIASPSDVVMRTGLPRYEVLGAFHVLEALGIVSIVHSRSNYKLYTLSELGKKILDSMINGGSLEDLITEGVEKTIPSGSIIESGISENTRKAQETAEQTA
jgi:DNA-binding IclR family transcriptional regulator